MCINIQISSGQKTLIPDSGSKTRESSHSICKDARSPGKCIRKKKKIADCFFIDLKCAPKKSDIFSHIANWAEAYKKHSKRGIDIKQLNEESNPPIDIHITKRERERERERICKIFTCCSNSFCLASSLLLSSRTVDLSELLLPFSPSELMRMMMSLPSSLLLVPPCCCSRRPPPTLLVRRTLYLREQLCNPKGEESGILEGVKHIHASIPPATPPPAAAAAAIRLFS
jgi:hypothetical protein